MKLAFLSLLFLSAVCRPLSAAPQVRCPICGMQFESHAPSSFHAKQGEKDHELCSFSCSLKFHRKFSDALLEAHDFSSKKRIDAKNAFFIAKSQNILKELAFDMPPSVVAFERKVDAEKKLKELKDGILIEGYSRLEKLYE
jgi:hypothetical protein